MIVVTGANGFIGSCIVWQLNQENLQQNLGPIIAVDSIERELPLSGRQVEKFLLKDDIWDFLKTNNQKITWVIHMGACSSTTETNKAFLDENNTRYTTRLFQWCSENNVPFIYASSGAVYGDGSKGFSDQTAPAEFEPLNLYGESKAAFDRWVVGQSKTPPNWYGLRFFNVYGPGEEHKEDMASVVYKAFLQIGETGKLKLFRSHREEYKDGHQERDFIYVKDISQWILQLMQKRPESGIYNMGFGKPRAWMDLANAVFKNLDKPVDIDWIDMPENIREQYQYTTCADMKKWQSQEGLSKPKWPLELGIADYIQFLRDGGHYL